MNQELSAFAKKRKTKKALRFAFLAILLIALLGTATYLLLENYFIVNEVLVAKSVIYDSKAISDCAAVKKGTPFYKLSKKEIEQKIEEQFPYLEEVTVSHQLPDRMKITFREEYGKFALPLGVELFSVDAKLNVLAKEKPDTQIKRIMITGGDVKRCVVGEKLSFIDEDTAPILLELAAVLDELELIEGVRSINVRNQFDIKINYADCFEITMGDHEDIPLKLAMVKEVMKDLGEGASGRIDISDADQAFVKLNDQLG